MRLLKLILVYNAISYHMRLLKLILVGPIQCHLILHETTKAHSSVQCHLILFLSFKVFVSLFKNALLLNHFHFILETNLKLTCSFHY